MQASFIPDQSSLLDKPTLFIPTVVIRLSRNPFQRQPAHTALVRPQPQVLGQADPALKCIVTIVIHPFNSEIYNVPVVSEVTNDGQVDVVHPTVTQSVTPRQSDLDEKKFFSSVISCRI